MSQVEEAHQDDESALDTLLNDNNSMTKAVTTQARAAKFRGRQAEAMVSKANLWLASPLTLPWRSSKHH